MNDMMTYTNKKCFRCGNYIPTYGTYVEWYLKTDGDVWDKTQAKGYLCGTCWSMKR